MFRVPGANVSVPEGLPLPLPVVLWAIVKLCTKASTVPPEQPLVPDVLTIPPELPESAMSQLDTGPPPSVARKYADGLLPVNAELNNIKQPPCLNVATLMLLAKIAFVCLR